MVRLIIDTREDIPSAPHSKPVTILALFFSLCELLFLLFLYFVAAAAVVYLVYASAVASPHIGTVFALIVEYPLVSTVLVIAGGLGFIIGYLV